MIPVQMDAFRPLTRYGSFVFESNRDKSLIEKGHFTSRQAMPQQSHIAIASGPPSTYGMS